MSDVVLRLIEPVSARDRADSVVHSQTNLPQTGMKVPFYWDDHLGAWLSVQTEVLCFGLRTATPGLGSNYRLSANGVAPTNPGFPATGGYTVPYDAIIVASSGACDDHVSTPSSASIFFYSSSYSSIDPFFWPRWRDGGRTFSNQAIYQRLAAGAEFNGENAVGTAPQRPRVQVFLKWIVETSVFPAPAEEAA